MGSLSEDHLPPRVNPITPELRALFTDDSRRERNYQVARARWKNHPAVYDDAQFSTPHAQFIAERSLNKAAREFDRAARHRTAAMDALSYDVED